MCFRVNPLSKFHPSLSYLVDFENSHYDANFKPTTWADLAPHLHHPDKVLREWGLETRELREML